MSVFQIKTEVEAAPCVSRCMMAVQGEHFGRKRVTKTRQTNHTRRLTGRPYRLFKGS